MDRRSAKKLDLRPKKVTRTDGSYWVVNPGVSEHFLTQQVHDIDRQKSVYHTEQNRQQRALQRELRNIKATKTYSPGPGYFRRRANKKQPIPETTFSDMIDKFNKKRVEQTLVNTLMKQRRESLNTLSAGGPKRSTAHIWDNVTGAKADVLHVDFDHGNGNISDEECLEESIPERKIVNSKQKKLSRRQSLYEVPKDRIEHSRMHVSYKSTPPRSKSKTSYVDKIGSGSFKFVRNQNKPVKDKPNEHFLNKRSATEFWSYERENTFYPEDVKSFQSNKLVKSDEVDAETKTDDEKLLEQKSLDKKKSEKKADTKKHNTSKYIKTKQKNETESKKPEEGKIIANGQIPNSRSDPTDAKTRNSDLHKRANGHIPNCKPDSSSVKKATRTTENSFRPKSAKGRIRCKPTTTTTTTTIATDNGKSKQRSNSTKNQNQNTKPEIDKKEKAKNIMMSDSESLNNYLLHPDRNENDTDFANGPDRKLSEFDLNLEDSFYQTNEHVDNPSGANNRDHEKEWSPQNESFRSRKDSLSSRHSSSNTATQCSSKDAQDGEHDDQSERQNDELWDDVRKCRYLRGYDPPEMVMPPNVNVFVFGKDENDIIEEIRQESILKKKLLDEQHDKEDDIKAGSCI